VLTLPQAWRLEAIAATAKTPPKKGSVAIAKKMGVGGANCWEFTGISKAELLSSVAEKYPFACSDYIQRVNSGIVFFAVAKSTKKKEIPPAPLNKGGSNQPP